MQLFQTYVTIANLQIHTLYCALPGLYKSHKLDNLECIYGLHNSDKHETSVCVAMGIIDHINLTMSSQVALKSGLTKI